MHPESGPEFYENSESRRDRYHSDRSSRYRGFHPLEWEKRSRSALRTGRQLRDSAKQ